MQIFGTIIGCMMSYVTMQQITTEKRDVLLAIQGTNAWSGQTLQKHNSAVRISNPSMSENDANETAGNYVGWSCQTIIWCRRPISMGFPRVSHWSCCSSSYIHFAQILPKASSQLLEYSHNLRCNGRPLAWNTQRPVPPLRPRNHVPILPSQVSTQLVHQVQLHHVCRVGWWCSSHQFHPHLHGPGRWWQSHSIPPILGKQPPKRKL
jgi:hypothetical protein